MATGSVSTHRSGRGQLTHSSNVCDWCCDRVSLGHDPLQGKMLKAKSPHEDSSEIVLSSTAGHSS